MSRSVAVFLAAGGVIIILRDVAKGAAHVSSDFGLLPSDGRVGVAGDANLRSKPAEPFDVIRAVREFVVLEERTLGFLQLPFLSIDHRDDQREPPQSRAHGARPVAATSTSLAGTATVLRIRRLLASFDSLARGACDPSHGVLARDLLSSAERALRRRLAATARPLSS